MPVVLVVDEYHLEILRGNDLIGRWYLAEVEVVRDIAERFVLFLGDDEMEFLAEDALHFAYDGVTAMQNAWLRAQKKKRRHRKAALDSARRKDETPAVEDVIVESALERSDRSPRQARPAATSELARRLAASAPSVTAEAKAPEQKRRVAKSVEAEPVLEPAPSNTGRQTLASRRKKVGSDGGPEPSGIEPETSTISKRLNRPKPEPIEPSPIEPSPIEPSYVESAKAAPPWMAPEPTAQEPDEWPIRPERRRAADPSKEPVKEIRMPEADEPAKGIRKRQTREVGDEATDGATRHRTGKDGMGKDGMGKDGTTSPSIHIPIEPAAPAALTMRQRRARQEPASPLPEPDRTSRRGRKLLPASNGAPLSKERPGATRNSEHVEMVGDVEVRFAQEGHHPAETTTGILSKLRKQPKLPDDHVHKFEETGSSVGLVRRVCVECSYVSIGNDDAGSAITRW